MKEIFYFKSLQDNLDT